MQYALFANQLEIPFTLGCLEDTPRVPAVDTLLGKIGYILTQRSRDQSIQQSYINQAVLREMITKHKLTMMY